VKDFLVVSTDDDGDLLIRYHAYFMALFQVARDEIMQIKQDLALSSVTKLTDDQIAQVAARFREYMTDGQQFRQQGPKRRSFYKAVVNKATQVGSSYYS
jgi:hypothetical protein